MSQYNLKTFYEGLKHLNISLTEFQVKQFLEYYELLIERNKVMNLTGITEFDEVIQKHFLDSLALTKVIDLSKTNSLIDIGTGAGFPGIPIKIVFPKIKVVLLDSLNKRIKFLNEVIDSLKLENIFAIHGRAEDFAFDIQYRECFDLCVSRAVANLSSLSEYCLPYVILGGKFISYKSGDVNKELENAKKSFFVLGGNFNSIIKFELPNSDIQRSFILVDKNKKTPKKYPRKAGMPTKDPIS